MSTDIEQSAAQTQKAYNNIFNLCSHNCIYI